jgi:hypothetical protein
VIAPVLALWACCGGVPALPGPAVCTAPLLAASPAPAAEEVVPVGERVAVFRISMRDSPPEARVGAIVRLVVEPHSRMVKPVARHLLDPNDGVAKASLQAISWIGASLGDLELIRAINIVVASLNHYAKRPGVATYARARLTELTGETHPNGKAWRTWWYAHAAKYGGLPPGTSMKPPTGPKRAAGPSPIWAAVDRGSSWLIERYYEHRGYTDGTALHLFALTWAGKQGDPHVQRAIKQLSQSTPSRVYEAAFQTMVLEKANARLYQSQIARRAWWLVNCQCESGAWGYTGPAAAVPTGHTRVQISGSRFGREVDPATGAGRETVQVERTVPWAVLPYADLSNAQIAVLALHAAERAHVRCPEETWKRVEQSWVKSSVRGGGWGYLQRTDIYPTGSMTAGGLGSLTIVREVLENTSAKRTKVERSGFRVLNKLGAFGEWRGGKSDQRGDIHSLYFYYWLYSLVRAAELSDKSKVGGEDWFAVMSDYLIKAQREDGSWGPLDGHPGRSIVGGPANERGITTAFALLFLSRAAPERRVQITLSARAK